MLRAVFHHGPHNLSWTGPWGSLHPAPSVPCTELGTLTFLLKGFSQMSHRGHRRVKGLIPAPPPNPRPWLCGPRLWSPHLPESSSLVSEREATLIIKRVLWYKQKWCNSSYSVNSGASMPQFEFQLHYLLDMRLWASHLTSLGFSFPLL